MPRNEQVLSVFVASPSDVTEERNRLEEVIRQLNVTWSHELGVSLDLIRWETHAYPGIGIEPQAIINEQIGDEYDIFIGIMWNRYGTPTAKHGSGTIEEFETARERHLKDPNSVSLMIYFKDEAIPPSQIDFEQAAKVRKFQKKLEEDGVLYWSFKDIEDFSKLSQLHLVQQIQAFKKKIPLSTQVTQNEKEESAKNTEQDKKEEDIGFLDYIEIIENSSEELTETLLRMSSYTKELAKKMDAVTAEINNTNLSKENPNARKEAKRLIQKASSDMNSFSERTKVEIPLFQNALNMSITSLIKAVEISQEIPFEDRERADIIELKNDLDELKESISSSLKGITDFQGTVSALPRMTGDLNRAKRQTVSVLDDLISEFQRAYVLMSEAGQSVEDIIN